MEVKANDKEHNEAMEVAQQAFDDDSDPYGTMGALEAACLAYYLHRTNKSEDGK